jgi:anti-sigma regulatory factor (Ser/Thr protein kinase)
VPQTQVLQLDASSRAAAEARRWVAHICAQLDREDLSECAELGVSELVTNAVLHARPPIRVRVRGTRTHPRVEVADASPVAPEPPPAEPEPDDFLATFGRGLSIVARSATAWGASIEPDGKVVWFEPATELRDSGAVGVFDSVTHQPEPIGEDAVRVRLRGLDVELFTALDKKYTELRRELRLLSLAHQDTYAQAGDLAAVFATFDRQFPRRTAAAVAAARRNGAKLLDLELMMSPVAVPILTAMAEIFDLADAFCRAERLLSIQRTPEEREFHLWYLGEFVRQLDGGMPIPWHDPPELHATRVQVS